jgi:hypothetical protein
MHTKTRFAESRTATRPRALTWIQSCCLISIMLMISGCGDDFGGTGNVASETGCTLTLEELQAIDNINNVPQECLGDLPAPDQNLLNRIFVLGTQINPASSALRIFVSGTDNDGNALKLADFQTATVSIDGVPVDPALVSVDPLAAGDDVLSLAFATDYSTSISDAELGVVSSMYANILDSLSPPNLPPVSEGMIINFSTFVEVRQDWTEDTALLKAALAFDDSFARQNTALYDAIGITLERDLDSFEDGLIERCRPAHMQVFFTDGFDNASFFYTKETVLPIIDSSKTVTIMLGSLSADKDLLAELAGETGGFVYAYSLQDIQSLVAKWAASLSEMVKFTLDPAAGFDGGNITITLGSETVAVERPVDGFCESTP